MIFFGVCLSDRGEEAFLYCISAGDDVITVDA